MGRLSVIFVGFELRRKGAEKGRSGWNVLSTSSSLHTVGGSGSHGARYEEGRGEVTISGSCFVLSGGCFVIVVPQRRHAPHRLQNSIRGKLQCPQAHCLQSLGVGALNMMGQSSIRLGMGENTQSANKPSQGNGKRCAPVPRFAPKVRHHR